MSGNIAPRRCEVCRELLIGGTRIGVCQKYRECRRERWKRYYERAKQEPGFMERRRISTLLYSRSHGTRPAAVVSRERRNGRYCYCNTCLRPVGYRPLSQIHTNGTYCDLHAGRQSPIESALPCLLCGHPTSSKTQVCTSKEGCKLAQARIASGYSLKKQTSHPCPMCRKPTASRFGVCANNPECEYEYNRLRNKYRSKRRKNNDYRKAI